MFRRSFFRLYLLGALAFSLGAATSSCTDENGNPVLFSVDDDKALGEQVARQTDSTYRAKGQLLERTNPRNARAYQLLDGVVNRVLNSGQLQYRNEFPWDVKIIKDDQIQNAFATPGGHIYVFTGLIKYLDNESQLAGVLGHEIAHADRRHTSRQLQNQYGINLLLSVVLGENPSQVAQIAAGLGQLKFSRDFEREADEFSVVYLNGTGHYNCNGTAGFFEKAQAEGQASGPEFLSTHPDPGSRVQAINAKATELNCTNRNVNNNSFQELKSIL
ncbi:M48 family metalloprotease [Hymenobacter latericus]|uniref:M48 family metalloprotease n=1 Tax=Hymenobacter sp. YIM 151858-1 TaxID=2987688 RepID=UPI0022278CE7|nr:M48 family metalloprotease [Hymenobacter sp. YIM 151858-1]UYZ60289.1 M48 family metalloprotease [Hymenobacter sp. YIM 151858-1]